MDKIIVYTCITGGKNELLEYEKEDGIEYICFSDTKIETKTDQWKICDLEWEFDDPRRTARYHKLMSHEVYLNMTTVFGLMALCYQKLESKI